jgi:hypothetical protein
MLRQMWPVEYLLVQLYGNRLDAHNHRSSQECFCCGGRIGRYIFRSEDVLV